MIDSGNGGQLQWLRSLSVKIAMVGLNHERYSTVPLLQVPQHGSTRAGGL